MMVQCLQELVKSDDKLFIQVRWKRLCEPEDTLEPLETVYEDVLDFVRKVVARKSTPADMGNEAHRFLCI